MWEEEGGGEERRNNVKKIKLPPRMDPGDSFLLLWGSSRTKIDTTYLILTDYVWRGRLMSQCILLVDFQKTKTPLSPRATTRDIRPFLLFFLALWVSLVYGMYVSDTAALLLSFYLSSHSKWIG